MGKLLQRNLFSLVDIGSPSRILLPFVVQKLVAIIRLRPWYRNPAGPHHADITTHSDAVAAKSGWPDWREKSYLRVLFFRKNFAPSWPTFRDWSLGQVSVKFLYGFIVMIFVQIFIWLFMWHRTCGLFVYGIFWCTFFVCLIFFINFFIFLDS